MRLQRRKGTWSLRRSTLRIGAETSRAASPAYLAELAALFEEKEGVRARLLEQFQAYDVAPW